METLKSLEEICEPDVRRKNAWTFENNNFRPMSAGDMYVLAAQAELHNGVPEEIQNHFQTARHLLIYSWFYYPFGVTAQLHATIAVEFALRIKAGLYPDPLNEKNSKNISFKKLLRDAVRKSWITDKGFSNIGNVELAALSKNFSGKTTRPSKQPYCDSLVNVLPVLRNELAHGSMMLHNQGASFVKICAELINQLFKKPNKKKVR